MIDSIGNQGLGKFVLRTYTVKQEVGPTGLVFKSESITSSWCPFLASLINRPHHGFPYWVTWTNCGQLSSPKGCSWCRCNETALDHPFACRSTSNCQRRPQRSFTNSLSSLFLWRHLFSKFIWIERSLRSLTFLGTASWPQLEKLQAEERCLFWRESCKNQVSSSASTQKSSRRREARQWLPVNLEFWGLDHFINLRHHPVLLLSFSLSHAWASSTSICSSAWWPTQAWNFLWPKVFMGNFFCRTWALSHWESSGYSRKALWCSSFEKFWCKLRWPRRPTAFAATPLIHPRTVSGATWMEWSGWSFPSSALFLKSVDFG